MTSQRLDILIVEDDQDARDSLQDILELDEHRVYAVASASSAFEGSTRQRIYDVIVLDRQLPDGLAEELLPRFRKAWPGADIIVVTGYADLEGTIIALRQGASDYIIKPLNPQALLTSLKRISRQRRTDRELQAERQFAEMILNTAEAIVLVLDVNGRIQRCNPYLLELTGYGADETLVGRDWFETFIPDYERPRIRRVFERTVQQLETRGIVNPILRKDGRTCDIRWSNTTINDANGRTTAVLAVGLDVSDLVATQRKLVQNERLAAIGQTMAGLAHESRNALQRLQNAVELLQDDLRGQPECLRDVAKIERASNDLRDLLEEVRAYAAPIHLERQNVAIRSVWQRAWTSLEGCRRNRDVRLKEFAPGCDPVCVDARRLEQVFRNLFENAIDACSDPVNIIVGCHDAGDSIVIWVGDNGPNLSGEQREHIFDAFFTTKATGTGLGLAIADRIIDAHQGTILLGTHRELATYSPEAAARCSGAIFFIRLPKRAISHAQTA